MHKARVPAPRPLPPARAPHPLLARYFEAVDRGVPPASAAPPAPDAQKLLLADPCGPAATEFAAIAAALEDGTGDALIVLHPEGLARIVHDRAEAAARLPALLGSAERAAQLIAVLHGCSGPDARAAAVLQAYRQLLTERTKATFITVFWIEDTWGRTAGHALFHATAQAPNFRLVKDLLWSISDARPGFRSRVLDPADPPAHPSRDAEAEALIHAALADQPRQVSHFTRTLPEQPGVQVAPKHFKQALLHLEATRRLRVLDKDGSGRPLPAAKRPKRQGVPTLGDDFWVERA